MKIKFSKEKRKRRGAWLKCKTCNKEFYVMPERLKRKFQPKYCSSKCYNKHGENNPFWGKKHSIETINKFMKNPNRHIFKTGKNNPNFVRFGKQSGFIGNNKDWWRYHKERKSSVCERCKFPDIRILQVHHKDRNRKNNNINNIEILCPNCHMLEHYLAKDGAYKNLSD